MQGLMCTPFSQHQAWLVLLLPQQFLSTSFWHQPFHSNIDFWFFLLHFLSHPILHWPHPPARFWSLLSHRQALCSAEHPPGFTGLLTLNSKRSYIRTVKSGSTHVLLPFTAYVFPFHNFNMLFFTFLYPSASSFSSFLSQLLIFLFSFFTFTNSLSQLPLRKMNTQEISLSPTPHLFSFPSLPIAFSNSIFSSTYFSYYTQGYVSSAIYWFIYLYVFWVWLFSSQKPSHFSHFPSGPSSCSCPLHLG